MSDEFANLENLDDLLDSAEGPVEINKKAHDAMLPRLYEETCTDCRGTGKFYSWAGRYVGPCHKCKGKGKRYFRSSPEQRQAQKDAYKAQKAKAAGEAAARLVKFNEEHPEIAPWIGANYTTNEFAKSLMDQLVKLGSLSEKQIAAVQNNIAREKARQEERQKVIENAPEVTLEKIETSFANAKENGLRFPKLRLDTFEFSPAGQNSANVGAIYVKEGETYLGKIMGGKFIKVKACDENTLARVIAVCADPAAAAEAYGKATGQCACCGRELTNEESIARSIGPICARKYGW